jgi:hypothetical protein
MIAMFMGLVHLLSHVAFKLMMALYADILNVLSRETNNVKSRLNEEIYIGGLSIEELPPSQTIFRSEMISEKFATVLDDTENSDDHLELGNHLYLGSDLSIKNGMTKVLQADAKQFKIFRYVFAMEAIEISFISSLAQNAQWFFKISICADSQSTISPRKRKTVRDCDARIPYGSTICDTR